MHPLVIQGGMGAGVSNWKLARTVSHAGQLGVVSGVGLPLLLARRLQSGDPGGDWHRALAHFPVSELVAPILRAYPPSGGAPFRPVPLHSAADPAALLALTVVANFCEVWLAKEAHGGIVGINYLEKMQFPILPSLYGALLAGVDYVLMGAGIPREIPGVLDSLVRHDDVSVALHVEGASRDDDYRLHYSPRSIGAPDTPLRRPQFLAIVASSVLATTLARKSTGRVDGFIIEGPTAGGHNAPPRGPLTLNAAGEPLYGPRDEVDLAIIRGLGLPFWLAGSYASPVRLAEARALGAEGVQVGTAFAFSRESGYTNGIKTALLHKARDHRARVFTDPLASPTGFPFKVAGLEGTLSEREVYQSRPRVCDLGYLRHAYKKPDGTIGYRCPAEPVDQFLRKGGPLGECDGRKCLCNALTANIGLGQQRESGYVEPPLVTSGDDLLELGRFLKPGADSYSALDVLAALLGR